MKRSASDIYAVPSKPVHAPSPAVPSPAARAGAPMRSPRRRSIGMGVVDRLSADFSPTSMTADQAIFAALHTARSRARELESSDAHVRKFLVMGKTQMIGSKGMRLRSKAGDWVKGRFVPSRFDQQLIEQAYEEFSRAENFSLDRRLNRRRFAQVAFQRVLVDGEFIAQKIRGRKSGNSFGYSLNMIDAERLDHRLNRKPAKGLNEIRMGVEIDAAGRPVAYYFLNDAPVEWMGISSIGNHERVSADEIIHIYIQERPGQTRGITWLAPTGLRTRMLDGITTAVTFGYRVAACKMGFFTRNENYQPPEDGDDFDGAVPQDASPGEFWELPEGLDFQDFDPGYPNAEYDDFKKSLVRELAGGLGVSYNELGNDYEGVSYSAGQIGVHADIAFWSDMQQFWVECFEDPVFRDWLLMAITTGALKLPITRLYKFQAAAFQPPRRKHIDPKKTAESQNLSLSAYSRDPFDVNAENGCDFEDTVENFARAVALLEENNLPVPPVWGNAVLQPTPDPETE